MNRLTRHRFILLSALLALWELLVRLGMFDKKFFAPPSEIAVAFLRLFENPDIIAATMVTAKEFFIALAIACVAGIAVGLLTGQIPILYRIAYPVLMLLFGIPKIAMLPLIILIFGIGTESKIFYGATSGFFPVVMNVIVGVQTVDTTLLVASRSMGANRAQIFGKVLIPASLPSILLGVRLGVTQTALGVLLAEMFAGADGLGYYAESWSSAFRPDRLFALFLLVALTSILLNEALRALERYTGRWRAELTVEAA